MQKGQLLCLLLKFIARYLHRGNRLSTDGKINKVATPIVATNRTQQLLRA